MGEGTEDGHSHILYMRTFIGIITLRANIKLQMLRHFHLEILLIFIYLKEITKH